MRSGCIPWGSRAFGVFFRRRQDGGRNKTKAQAVSHRLLGTATSRPTPISTFRPLAFFSANQLTLHTFPTALQTTFMIMDESLGTQGSRQALKLQKQTPTTVRKRKNSVSERTNPWDTASRERRAREECEKGNQHWGGCQHSWDEWGGYQQSWYQWDS